MKTMRRNWNPGRQNGFVLVTSLIFLVVITLLAVSAINSSTLQERMASNLRDKSRARQASDATLRHAETLLNQPVFDTYQPAGAIYGATNQDSPATTGTVHIWQHDSMFASKPDDESTAFLNADIWKGSTVQTYQADSDLPKTASRLPPVAFYVEDLQSDFQPRDLNPDTSAQADGGQIYRITARAQGENPAAISVTQSLYEKRY